jgi:hypothetical protein
MPILDIGATSDNMFARKAVYIILGVMVEKCVQQIRTGGVDRVLLFIKDGLNSEYPILLNGALFTLWRFVEYFKVRKRITRLFMLPHVLNFFVFSSLCVARH